MIQYFQITRKWKNSPHSMHHFYIIHFHQIKKLLPRISFRVKTTDTDNQYDLYSRTCADVSSMIEIFDLTVLYAPVAGIRSLCIINTIVSAEGLIMFVLDIYNDFQNTIPLNPAEIVYISLPHIYLERLKKSKTSISFNK